MQKASSTRQGQSALFHRETNLLREVEALRAFRDILACVQSLDFRGVRLLFFRISIGIIVALRDRTNKFTS